MATRLPLVHCTLLLIAIMSLCGNSPAQPTDSPVYRDAAQPIEVRVEDLLRRMTLAEKVGQINMPCVYVGGLGLDVPGKMEGCRKFALGQLEPGIGPAGG